MQVGIKTRERNEMSMPLVALCADEESLRNPEMLGLGGENLAAQSWLQLFSSAEQARCSLRNDTGIQEVWVASCDEVAPINLAAALKRDRRDRRVCMLSAQESGSLRSRASAAGIDASFTRQAFVERYALCKQIAMSASASAPVQPAFGGPALAGPAGGSAVAPACAPAKGAQPAFAQPAYGGAQPQAQQQAPAQGNSRGFLLPVVSGSGGAGKSAVALLAAYAAQRMGKSTLLLDFDLQFGDMAELAGVQHPLRIDEAIANPERLTGLQPQGNVPALLAAPLHIDAAEAVVAQAPALLETLRGRFDVIVANTGGAWAEQHAVLLERSSKALFLIDQRMSSVYACKRALDLCARCGIAVNPLLFVLNGCGKGAPLSSMDVSCALKGAHVHELADGGADVEDMLAAHGIEELFDARNELVASIEQLLAEVIPGMQGSQPGEHEGAGLPFLRGKKPRKRRRA